MNFCLKKHRTQLKLTLVILMQYNQKTKKDERDVERMKIEQSKPKPTSPPKQPKVEPKVTKPEPSPLAARTQDEWQKNSESHNGAVRYAICKIVTDIF